MSMTNRNGEITAANPLATRLSGSTPLDDESVTVTSAAAVGLAGAVGNRRAVIGVQGGTIRYRVSGTAPDATTGMKAGDGDVIELDHEDQISGFQAIATADDATLFVTYF